MSIEPPTDPLPNADRLARSLASMVIDRLRLPREGRVVIAVAGESGSGKSTTASSLGRELSTRGVSTGLIHQDDYFLRPPRTNHEYRLLDLRHVGPHAASMPESFSTRRTRTRKSAVGPATVTSMRR